MEWDQFVIPTLSSGGELAMAQVGVSTILSVCIPLLQKIPDNGRAICLCPLQAMLIYLRQGFAKCHGRMAALIRKSSKATQSCKILIHKVQIPEWKTLDDKSFRFELAKPSGRPVKVVLLQSSYVGLAPPCSLEYLSLYTRFHNFYFPDRTLLLESLSKPSSRNHA